MLEKELEARNKKKVHFFFALLASVFPVYMLIERGGKLFDSNYSFGKLMVLFIFCSFSLVAIFWWGKFFDNTIQFAICKDGVLVKKNLLPFSGLKLLQYSDLEYFFIESETSKGITGYALKFGFLNPEMKELKVSIGEWDKGVDEICQLLDYHASKHKFRNSGINQITS